MASDAAVTNNFTAGTPAVADDVDTNFADLVTWLNTNAVHLDGSKAFTGIPSGPASDPTTANQLTRKAYVDSVVGGRGVVATATKTSGQGSITSVTDVTSLSVTFTAVTGRRYRLSFQGQVYSSVSGDTVQVQITDSTNAVQNFGIALASSGYSMSIRIDAYVTPSAGSVTYKVRALRNTGSGTVGIDCGSTYPAFLVAEDVGV